MSNSRRELLQPAMKPKARLIEPDFLLWDNPKAKTDRMVILGSKSIIYANPAASDVPHIMGLFNEKKMLRDLLGEDAGTIKLESIQRLTANPKRSNLDIDYKPNEKTVTHQLMFSTTQVRDEALDALQLRLGADFTRTTRKFSLADKILVPLLIIVLVAVIGWVLIDGLSYLEGAAWFPIRHPPAHPGQYPILCRLDRTILHSDDHHRPGCPVPGVAGDQPFQAVQPGDRGTEVKEILITYYQLG